MLQDCVSVCLCVCKYCCVLSYVSLVLSLTCVGHLDSILFLSHMRTQDLLVDVVFVRFTWCFIGFRAACMMC